ncbi:MAG: hypothetical protein AB7T31_15835 [Gemmatimonadales bacterium]
MKRTLWLAAAVVVLAPADAALAQFSPGARSVGMGGAGMVFARGVDAIEWNPANLALEGGWNLALGEVGTSALVTGADIKGLQDIFEFELPVFSSDGGSQQQAVNDLPASGLSLAIVSEGFLAGQAASSSDGAVPSPGEGLPSIGLAWGQFGVRIRSRLMGDVRLSKELVDLIANGFDPSRIDEYQVGNTGFRTVSFSEITGAYGTMLGDRMALGVGVRYVKGHKLTEGRFFEPVLDLVDEIAVFNSVAIEAPGGSGYGVDVGFALDLMAGLRVSASAVNIIQKMTWDDALIAHEAALVTCESSPSSSQCINDPSLNDSFDDDSDPEDLIDEYQASPVDPSSMSLYVAQTIQDLLPGAYFPTVFRAGVGWRAGGTALELVGATVSPRGRQRSQWDERISLGLEQRLWFLTLRAGGAKGSDGIQVLSGGLGLGFGPVKLDVSAGMMSGGFEFASDLVAPEDVNYAGGQLTLSLQVMGGGR